VSRYTTKPNSVEAVQWDGSNWHLMLELAGRDNVGTDHGKLFFDDGAGVVTVPLDAWIVKGAIAPGDLDTTLRVVEDPLFQNTFVKIPEGSV